MSFRISKPKSTNRPVITLGLEALETRDVPAPFTAGNLVVYRVGTGSAALSSAATAVFLDEYTPSGTFVQSVAAPTTINGTNQILTASGTASSEGLLSRSPDGTSVALTGYGATLGTASVAGSSTAAGASQVLRVIGSARGDGTLDTTTTTTSFSANNIRGAVIQGNNVWADGAANGVVYNTLGGSGAGTAVSTTATNLRALTGHLKTTAAVAVVGA